MALKMMKILMMMATAFLMKMMSFKFDCIEMYSYIDEIDDGDGLENDEDPD